MDDGSSTGAPVHRTIRMSFGMVDPAVIRDETLPTAVRTVYTYLCTYCSDERSAYPSRARIARQTGMSVRTVDAAIRTAEQVGLFTVQRRRNGKVNETNIYHLHDFGGGYIAEGGAVVAPGVAQEMHEGGATAAPELDNVSRPVLIETTVFTSSDAGSGPPLASSRGDLKIILPRNWDKRDDGKRQQAVVACCTKALTAAGYSLSQEAGDRIGRSLKYYLDKGRSWEHLVTSAESWLNNPAELKHLVEGSSAAA